MEIISSGFCVFIRLDISLFEPERKCTGVSADTIFDFFRNDWHMFDDSGSWESETPDISGDCIIPIKTQKSNWFSEKGDKT